MKVTQIATGRFHHFHLARQMEKNGLLDNIYTGYPMFKLKDENSIPKHKIISFPWIHTPYMRSGWLRLDKWIWLKKQWEWIDHESLDRYVAGKIKDPTILIALSGTGLHAGKKTKKLGGTYICDRGSSHIRYQNEILTEEYEKWGLQFEGIDPRIIKKEEEEYALADFITVPSEFVRQSFIEKGVSAKKLVKIPYGARLDRFKKTGEPDNDSFKVLWVGGVSIRKGFYYALEAFRKLQQPNKEFIVIGSVSDEVSKLIKNIDLNGITFKGVVPNAELVHFYSTSHVFVLPSLEEGLAMVQGEAMACGCPVIASTNTGAADLFTDGVEGFIVPIRAVDKLAQRMQELADDDNLRKQMSEAAMLRVQSLGGWDTYGTKFKELIDKL